MARGAKQQQDLENSAASTYQSQGNQAFQAEFPVLQGQLQNPGFDPVTAAAIRRSGMDTVNSAFDASKFSAAQRAGQTGNDAMFYASNDTLARDRANALSDAATKAEVTIGKQKLDSQQQAIQDASQLYNFGNTAGDARSQLATQSMIARPSVLQDITGAMGAAGSLAGGIGGLIKGIKS